jgi:hypothetical protein
MDRYHIRRLVCAFGLAVLAMPIQGAHSDTVPTSNGGQGTGLILGSSACASAANHWWDEETSGTGSTVQGTLISTSTPAQWSVDSNSKSTWDEAAWIENPSNSSQALEVGFYSGWWPYPNFGWTNSLVSYMTEGGGTAGSPAWNNLYGVQWGPSQGATLWAEDNGTVATGHFSGPTTNGWVSFQQNYAIAAPRENYAQAEVTNSTSTWMGGGSGETFNAYWEDTSGAVHAWGSHSGCASSPYWDKNLGPNQYENGGY